MSKRCELWEVTSALPAMREPQGTCKGAGRGTSKGDIDPYRCTPDSHLCLAVGQTKSKVGGRWERSYCSARNNCRYKTLQSLQIMVIFSKMRFLKMRYLLRQESLSFKWLNAWVYSCWLWLHECQIASIIIIRFWIRVKGILITVCSALNEVYLCLKSAGTELDCCGCFSASTVPAIQPCWLPWSRFAYPHVLGWR